MLKLMKYEFKKQAFSKLVILCLVAIIEVVFLLGVFLDKEGWTAASMGVLWIVTLGAMTFLAFEAIITFSNDLKTKCSYMLFLTPTTTYSIVGAKVLAAAIQGIVAACIFAGIFILDGGILVARYDFIAEIKQLIVEFSRQFLKLDIDMVAIFSFVATTLTSWLSTITIAFFSITLSTTFLANNKLKGLISFVIFIAINIFIYYIMDLVLGYQIDNLADMTKYNLIASLFSLVFTVITYFGTAWMLDKKVSV
jgi:ABC-2 type transport system permease protein